MPTNVRVRPATADDLPAIIAIYAPHVLGGLASFEVEVPDIAEMLRRRDEILQLGLPYLVAESDGQVAGFASAHHFRPRAAYRRTVENSVYVADRFQRSGMARHLMQHLIADCAQADMREMIAVIAAPSVSVASVALHRSLGFREFGLLHGVGENFGRSLDVLLMQRSLAARESAVAPR